MLEVLYTGRLSGSCLTQLIKDCAFQDRARFLGEQLPSHIVDTAKRSNLLLFTWYLPTIEFASYTTGRVFDQNGELRWEREADQFHVVYLGSEQNAAVLQEYGCREQTPLSERIRNGELKRRSESKTYILFGQLLNADVSAPEGNIPYAEARIPRILYYPFLVEEGKQKPERIAISVAEYADSKSGPTLAYRFQSLQEVEKSK